MQPRSALTSMPTLDVLCLAKVDDAVLTEMSKSDAYIRSLTQGTELWYAKVEASFDDVLKFKPPAMHIEDFYRKARYVHTRITKKGTCKALLQAVKNNNLMDMRIVLHAGADVNAADKSGNIPLIWASRFGHLEAVKELLHAKANVNATSNTLRTALTWAAETGQLEIVKELLRAGANVNHANNRGWTALLYASDSGDLEIAKELVKHGANVNAADRSGWTSKLYASVNGYPEIADLLRAHGAH